MEAEQKKDAFLACITFSLLRALVAPQKLKDRTYEQLVAALTTHVAPKPLVIAERTVPLPQTGQKEGESVICGMQQVCRTRTVRLVLRYQRIEGTGVGKGVPTRDHSVKELKGDDESKEEWDRLKWGSLHGLAKDKRNGMKQRTMGKPICIWSSS